MTRSKVRRGATLVALMTPLALGAPAIASAATVSVCASGCDSSTISGAIAIAAPGDTVHVLAGTYAATAEPDNQVVVSKGITLEGVGSSTVIDGGLATIPTTGKVGTLAVTADADVTVRDLTVKNAGARNGVSVAVFDKSQNVAGLGHVHTFDHVTVVGNGASGNDYGFYSDDNRADAVFTDGSITGTGFNPMLVERPYGRTTVTGNTLSIASGQASSVYFSMNYGSVATPGLQTIAGNTMTGRNGISVVGAYSNLAGTAGGFPGGVHITGNDITMTGLGGRGISVSNQRGTAASSAEGRVVAPQISANTVSGTGTGVFLFGDVPDPAVIGNTLAGLGVGASSIGVWRIDQATGGAPSGAQIHANRLSGDAVGVMNLSSAADVDATENWWGCNAGPGGAGCSPLSGNGIDADPWLMLSISGPAALTYPATGMFTASVATTSDNTPASDPGSFPAAGVAFGASAGSVDSPKTLSNSTAATTLTPPAVTGPVTVTATLDHQTVGATTVVTVPKQATTLRARALLLSFPPFALPLGTAQATLTDSATGAPLAGRVIVFSAGSTTMCQATTNADGVASCSAQLGGLLASVLNLGYTATFAGDLYDLPSGGTGAGHAPLIQLGFLRLF